MATYICTFIDTKSICSHEQVEYRFIIDFCHAFTSYYLYFPYLLRVLYQNVEYDEKILKVYHNKVHLHLYTHAQ